jgi:hypothetical protein
MKIVDQSDAMDEKSMILSVLHLFAWLMVKPWISIKFVDVHGFFRINIIHQYSFKQNSLRKPKGM